MQVLVVIVLTVLVLAVWLGSHARNLLDQRREIEQVWEKLSAELQRRQQAVNAWEQELAAELKAAPALYAPLPEACRQAQAAEGKAHRLQAENELGEKLGRFLQDLEKQPGVLESPAYLSAREAAVNLEDEIAALQSHYNDLVVSFNARQNVWPDRLLVSKLGLTKLEEFVLLYPFAEHHLTYKRVLPAARKSIFGVAPEKSRDNNEPQTT